MSSVFQSFSRRMGEVPSRTGTKLISTKLAQTSVKWAGKWLFVEMLFGICEYKDKGDVGTVLMRWSTGVSQTSTEIVPRATTSPPRQTGIVMSNLIHYLERLGHRDSRCIGDRFFIRYLSALWQHWWG